MNRTDYHHITEIQVDRRLINMDIKVKLSTELSRDDISLITWWEGKLWGESNKPYRILDDKDYFEYIENHSNDIFVVAYDEELIGFGVIYDISPVRFMDKHYDILGTGSLVSIKKGIGVGTLIVRTMEKYLESQDKSSFGFCDNNSLGFHKRMNREVWEDAGKRFICNGEISTDHLIVHRGKDGFTELLEKYPEEKVYVEQCFW